MFFKLIFVIVFLIFLFQHLVYLIYVKRNLKKWDKKKFVNFSFCYLFRKVNSFHDLKENVTKIIIVIDKQKKIMKNAIVIAVIIFSILIFIVSVYLPNRQVIIIYMTALVFFIMILAYIDYILKKQEYLTILDRLVEFEG